MKSNFVGWYLPALIVAAMMAANGKCDTISLKKSKPGVSVNESGAFEGFTLVAPMKSTYVYLVDMNGQVVHTWDTGCLPGLNTLLLDNGHLLRTCATVAGTAHFPGVGGRILEFTWDGEVVWDYTFPGKDQIPHHDITRLPNGNILMVVADKKSAKEAIAAGRKSDMIHQHIYADAIFEVRPTGKTTGEIVWEWHVWDHLAQDHDRARANYGRVSSRPERIDINFATGLFGKLLDKKDEFEKLKGLGYLGGSAPKDLPIIPMHDWTHVNSVAYNADLDQIVLTSFGFHEIWIIDHSTTTAEAAGSTGGKFGKGGDLLYRWGNPKAYRSGTNADQRLYVPHNAHWIPQGMPGAGNLLVFNNGVGRAGGNYSSVEEIVLPTLKNGGYDHKPGTPIGPKNPQWTYTTPAKTDFFASFVSGAHRVANGNTLICNGTDKVIFEVTPEKEIVWVFRYDEKSQHTTGGRPATALPSTIEQSLKLTPEQRKRLDQLQTDLTSKLDKILTETQKAELRRLRGAYDESKGQDTGGIFRSYRFGVDHPAVQGRGLSSQGKNSKS